MILTDWTGDLNRLLGRIRNSAIILVLTPACPPALKSAGVPVSPRMVITAGNLASQPAPLVLRPRSRSGKLCRTWSLKYL